MIFENTYKIGQPLSEIRVFAVGYILVQQMKSKLLRIIKHHRWATLLGQKHGLLRFCINLEKQSHGCMKFHE